MSLFDLDGNIIRLSSVDSTNDYLKELVHLELCKEGTIIVASEQKKGKGAHGNSWMSEAQKNLILSFALFPSFLLTNRGFFLNIMLCAAVCKVLSEDFKLNAKIKWPNDILINDRKVCGILVENTLKNDRIQGSVLGIGINVNQQNFPHFSIPATSLYLENNHLYVIEDILHSLTGQIDRMYSQLKQNQTKELLSYYLEHLYGYKEFRKFQDMNGFFDGKISGISQMGDLIVEVKNGNRKYFSPKEIRFTSLISEDAEQAY